MRKMIDPSTIKVDTSNLAKLNMTKEGDAEYSSQTFSSDTLTTEKGRGTVQVYAGQYSGIWIPETVHNNKLRIGTSPNWKTNDPTANGIWSDYCHNWIATYKNSKKIVTYFSSIDGSQYMLTNKNVKTIFGNSIYSENGTGNINLYAHDITITKGTGKAFLTVYSSKNTNINSLDVLKTIAGATFTKSCTGYINSKVIVAITETSFILADGTTEALTGATFVDTPTTI